jgi:hypothetical protein
MEKTVLIILYFIVLVLITVGVVITLIVKAPEIPEPLSFYDALSRLCPDVELPF